MNLSSWLRPSWLPSTSSAAVLRSSWYSVFADRSWDGAMIARRLSVGSRRTSNGMLGLKDSALFRLPGSMARVKSRVR